MLFDHWSLEIRAGERLALTGPQRLRQDDATATAGGTRSTRRGKYHSPTRTPIGMVFQDLALWPNLTALQNVTFALNHLPRAERATAAQEALQNCQVAGLAQRRPGTLSIGQQQRVALARALAAKPDLLLLDEPFSSLHPTLREELLAMLDAVCGADIALVLVTHDVGEAHRLCCRVEAVGG